MKKGTIIGTAIGILLLGATAFAISKGWKMGAK